MVGDRDNESNYHETRDAPGIIKFHMHLRANFGREQDREATT